MIKLFVPAIESYGESRLVFTEPYGETRGCGRIYGDSITVDIEYQLGEIVYFSLDLLDSLHLALESEFGYALRHGQALPIRFVG